MLAFINFGPQLFSIYNQESTQSRVCDWIICFVFLILRDKVSFMNNLRFAMVYYFYRVKNSLYHTTDNIKIFVIYFKYFFAQSYQNITWLKGYNLMCI